MTQAEIDELTTKKLCHCCADEAYLKTKIRNEGKHLTCSYCDRKTETYPIGEVAELIERAFTQYYVRTSDQPTSWQYSLLSDRESSYDWERDGEPVVYAIMNAAEIPQAASEDIQQILEYQYEDFESAQMGEETEFSAEAYYEEKGISDEAWQEEWRWFESSLKTEARFFSKTAAQLLTSVFDGIETMCTHDGRPLLVDAEPGTAVCSVYRARVFQSDEKLKEALCRPDAHLGTPPTLLASASRMNAQGISVFYGSNDPSIAIAEVRPPVGSQVAVARFEIIRPLRLLDLTALGAVSISGSIFDPEHADCLERIVFLRSLSERKTKPVMPDDEAFEYLPTQAVADFLATEASVPLNGILFPSVQTSENALNVVLFHNAALVEPLKFPKATEITAHKRQMTEDGRAAEYSVIEEVPANKDKSVDELGEGTCPGFGDLNVAPWEAIDDDNREASLRIVLDSVEVHVVRGVRFETEVRAVGRQRMEKRESGF